MKKKYVPIGMLLSIIPGFGYFYTGQAKKAVTYFVLFFTVLSFYLFFLYPILDVMGFLSAPEESGTVVEQLAPLPLIILYLCSYADVYNTLKRMNVPSGRYKEIETV